VLTYKRLFFLECALTDDGLLIFTTLALYLDKFCYDVIISFIEFYGIVLYTWCYYWII